MATESICGRCAGLGKTCCQETEIYLTTRDVQRITAYVGRADFHEYRRPADPTYLDQADDPAWQSQTIRADGSRRVLKWRELGNCLFLGAHGCQLPMTTRPLVCRLHPLTYTQAGLAGVLDQRCLLAHRQSAEGLIEALGMTLTQTRGWHLQLYTEIFDRE